MNSWKTRLQIYLGYFWGKLSVLTEVKSPLAELLCYEFLYTFANLVRSIFSGFSYRPLWKFKNCLIVTTWGKFQVRPGSQDAALISPAFERPDFLWVVQTIDELIRQGRQICFLDIGANIGKFSVTLGRRFPGGSLRIVAIEALSENMELLRTNIQLNRIPSSVVSTVQMGVWSEARTLSIAHDPRYFGDTKLVSSNGPSSGSRSIQVAPLDSLGLEPRTPREVLFVKMDIEGAELEALKGAPQTLAKFHEIFFLIEDMHAGSALAEYLKALGAEELARKTNYNSLWHRI